MPVQYGLSSARSLSLHLEVGTLQLPQLKTVAIRLVIRPDRL